MREIVIVNRQCVRCHHRNTKPYWKRFLCLDCGFTFHENSVDEQDEIIRRLTYGMEA